MDRKVPKVGNGYLTNLEAIKLNEESRTYGIQKNKDSGGVVARVNIQT